MKEEFNQIKYQNDFNRKNYDRIGLMLPKGKKEDLKRAAKEAGMSMNEYVIQKIFGDTK